MLARRILLGLLLTALPAPSGALAGATAPAVEAAACYAHDGLPDRHCTPGATDPRVTPANVTRTICVSGWTARVRSPTSVTTPIKTEREIAYGIPAPHPKSFGAEELDHLIPLELGGAPKAIANLWPEAAAGRRGYHRKDVVETKLKRMVCAGRLGLRAAQHAFATDWLGAYRHYVGSLP